MKKQLFSTIFLLFIALSNLSAAPRGDYRLVVTTRRFVETSPEVDAVLRNSSYRIKRLLRLNFDRAVELEVILTGRRQTGGARLEYGRLRWKLWIDGTGKNWLETPGMLKRFYGAVVAAGAGFAPPVSADWLPDWVVHALRSRIESADREERFMTGNRDVSLLAAFAEAGTFPHFSALLTLDSGIFSAAEELLYSQMGRAVLEVASAHNLMVPYLRELAAGESSEAAGRRLFDRLSKEGGREKSRAVFDCAASAWCWNDFAPRPAELSRREFVRLRGAFEYPEFDANGELTGKNLSAPFDRLPEILSRRPDAPALRLKLSNLLRDFLSDDARELKIELKPMGDDIVKLGVDRDAGERFCAKLDMIEASFKRRAAIEARLAEVELAHTPALWYWNYPLAQSQVPDAALTPASEHFVRSVEAKYLSE